MSGALATRTMKARRTSTCPMCRAPVYVGQLIAKCGTWMHATCLIGHRHDRKQETGQSASTGSKP